MSEKIPYMLYMNMVYIFLGGLYLFWVWKDKRAPQRKGQLRRGTRNRYLYYMAVGFWPFLISGLLALALLLYGISTLSFLGFSLYYLSTGLLYYCSGWRLLPKLSSLYGTSPYPGASLIGNSQVFSGVGVILGLAFLSFTFGPPFDVLTHSIWYRACFFVIGASLMGIGTIRMLNRLNRRIEQRK